MNKVEIKALLDRFWESETTAQEEAQLKAYFQSEEVDAEFAFAKSYFKSNAEQKDVFASIASKLIQKYFEGNSTLEEEGVLKEYFMQTKVHSDLLQYRPVFRSLEMIKNLPYDKELKLKQVAKIIEINTTNREDNVIPLQGSASRRAWIKYAIAAMFVGVCGTALFNFNRDTITSGSIVQNAYPAVKQSRVIEPKTPEEALEITMNALAMVSKKYKKGQSQILTGMKTVSSATEILN